MRSLYEAPGTRPGLPCPHCRGQRPRHQLCSALARPSRIRAKPADSGRVVRNIQIIGEAANHINRVAPEFVTQHPELPWSEMRGMRNIVVHAYFAVDWDTVWKTVTEDLPRLQQQINDLLNQQQPDPDGSK